MTEETLPQIKKPDITKARTQEDYEDLLVEYAKYFAVVEIRPGAWRRGASNFIRTEHPTYDEALAESKRRYEIEKEPKRGSLIYAIADFPGARNMSALVDAYPKVSGPYTREGREERMKGKKPKASKLLPSTTLIEKTERHFEASDVNPSDYPVSTTKIVKAGNNQRAIKYRSKR